VLVESSIPEDVPGVLLTIFGGATACVIALMLVSSLYAMYILVAILRYDCVARDVPFDEFWRKRCDPDFKLSLRCFSNGIPLFMIVVALVAWMNFWSSPSKYVAASVVTVIVLAVTAFWFSSISRKWMSYLLESNSRILTRGASWGMKNDVGSQERSTSGNDSGGGVSDQESAR